MQNKRGREINRETNVQVEETHITRHMKIKRKRDAE